MVISTPHPIVLLIEIHKFDFMKFPKRLWRYVLGNKILHLSLKCKNTSGMIGLSLALLTENQNNNVLNNTTNFKKCNVFAQVAQSWIRFFMVLECIASTYSSVSRIALIQYPLQSIWQTVKGAHRKGRSWYRMCIHHFCSHPIGQNLVVSKAGSKSGEDIHLLSWLAMYLLKTRDTITIKDKEEHFMWKRTMSITVSKSNLIQFSQTSHSIFFLWS